MDAFLNNENCINLMEVKTALLKYTNVDSLHLVIV